MYSTKLIVPFFKQFHPDLRGAKALNTIRISVAAGVFLPFHFAFVAFFVIVGASKRG